MSKLKTILLQLLTMFTFIIFTGCGAHYHSVHYIDKLKKDTDEAITVDAKQRFLISNVAKEERVIKEFDKNGTRKTVDTKVAKLRRYCAEYSPDVFTILGQASSGSGSVGKSATGTNVGLSFSMSSSETGATIERTQTINMLKEMMYRTCERYLNGSIDKFEYSTIAARDQRIMVSILAIEQLTGTVKSKPTVIGSTSESSTEQSNKNLLPLLNKALENMNEKKGIVKAAQKDFNEVNDKNKTSAYCTKVIEDKNTTNDDLTKCLGKKEKLDDATKDFKVSEEHYNLIANYLDTSKNASSKVQSTNLLTSQTTELDKEIEVQRYKTIEKVSDVVHDIVTRSFSRGDETAFFCYKIIKSNPDSNTSQECQTLLAAMLSNEAEKLRLEKSKYEDKIKKLDDRKKTEKNTEKQFDKIWPSIKTKHSNTVHRNNITTLIETKNPCENVEEGMKRDCKKTLENMKTAGMSERTLLELFKELPLEARIALSKED